MAVTDIQPSKRAYGLFDVTVVGRSPDSQSHSVVFSASFVGTASGCSNTPDEGRKVTFTLDNADGSKPMVFSPGGGAAKTLEMDGKGLVEISVR